MQLREGGRTARPARPPIRSTRLQRGVSSHREGGARAPIERPAARVALFPRPRFHARRTNHTTHPPEPPPVPFQPTTTATRRRRVRSDNGRQEIDTPFGKKTLQVFDLAASRALDVVFLAVDGDFALKWAEKIAEGAVARSPARVVVGASDRSVVGESASARARRVRFGCVARSASVVVLRRCEERRQSLIDGTLVVGGDGPCRRRRRARDRQLVGIPLQREVPAHGARDQPRGEAPSICRAARPALIRCRVRSLSRAQCCCNVLDTGGPCP